MNNISEIKKKSLLFISDDIKYLEQIENGFFGNYNIKTFSQNQFYLLTSEINNFDLIIFDNSTKNLEKFVKIFKVLKTYNFNTPTILIEDSIEDDLSLYKCVNTYAIFPKSCSLEMIFKNIEIAFNFTYTNKKVQMEQGFYFDVNRELLFKGKKIIKLTKIEKKLMKLLADNANELVTYEAIFSVVWKGKEFSIYSLRNVIKHIREKTDESFIKNSSNRGYVLNTL